MATISKIKRKKGVVYRVRIRRDGHDSISQVFDRQSDATRWVEDTESILRSGGYVGDAAPGVMPFDKALNRYELEVSSKKNKYTNQGNHLKTSSKGFVRKFYL